MANVQTSKQAKPNSCVRDNIHMDWDDTDNHFDNLFTGSTRWWLRWQIPRQWQIPCGRVTTWVYLFLISQKLLKFSEIVLVARIQHEHFAQMPQIPFFRCQLEPIMGYKTKDDMLNFLPTWKTHKYAWNVNVLCTQYTDELTPHVEWLEDKKTLANRWIALLPSINLTFFGLS